MRNTFEQDLKWFEEHHAELLAQYTGLHVALIDAKVVDSDPDFSELAKRVYAKHGYRAIVIQRVTEDYPEKVYVLGADSTKFFVKGAGDA